MIELFRYESQHSTQNHISHVKLLVSTNLECDCLNTYLREQERPKRHRSITSELWLHSASVIVSRSPYEQQTWIMLLSGKGNLTQSGSCWTNFDCWTNQHERNRRGQKWPPLEPVTNRHRAAARLFGSTMFWNREIGSHTADYRHSAKKKTQRQKKLGAKWGKLLCDVWSTPVTSTDHLTEWKGNTTEYRLSIKHQNGWHFSNLYTFSVEVWTTYVLTTRKWI